MKRKASYFEKLKDPRWQKKRLEILERDEFKCRDCGAADKELHVHHCHYEKGKEPWETASAFLLTLCKDCHESRQKLEDEAKLLFGALLARTVNQQGIDEALLYLVRSLQNQALHDGYTLDQCALLSAYPFVSNSFEFQHLTDERWFHFCKNNPAASCRAMYEEIAGRKVRW